VRLIQSKMEENKADFDAKMLEYAQLLDIRAARVKQLERQLTDIAYGTRQVRAPSANHLGEKRRDSFSFVGHTPSDNQLVADLQRGQNIFEIHLSKVSHNQPLSDYDI
jgi:protein fantom